MLWGDTWLPCRALSSLSLDLPTPSGRPIEGGPLVGRPGSTPGNLGPLAAARTLPLPSSAPPSLPLRPLQLQLSLPPPPCFAKATSGGLAPLPPTSCHMRQPTLTLDLYLGLGSSHLATLPLLASLHLREARSPVLQTLHSRLSGSGLILHTVTKGPLHGQTKVTPGGIEPNLAVAALTDDCLPPCMPPPSRPWDPELRALLPLTSGTLGLHSHL